MPTSFARPCWLWGVGMIRDDASVAEVIDAMCTGAQRLLAGWGG